jgi:hypothetical protein
LRPFAYGTTKTFNIENTPSSGGLARAANCRAPNGYVGASERTSIYIAFNNPPPDDDYTVTLTMEGNAIGTNSAYLLNKSRNGFTIAVRESGDFVNPVNVDFAVYVR